MIGYVRYGDGRTRALRQRIGGGSFQVVEVRQTVRPGSFLARRRASRAAQALYAAGVRRAVFPVDFPHLSIFVRRGVCPVDVLPIRQALAVPLILRQMESLGVDPMRAVAAVSGQRLSRPLLETTRALALRCRYTMLWTGESGEGFARSLRREYGVSLLLQPSAEQMERADILVLFADREDLSGGNPIFHRLYPGGEAGQFPLMLPRAVDEALEPACCREQMSAALYAIGVLKSGDILAEIPVDRMEKCLYNGRTII